MDVKNFLLNHTLFIIYCVTFAGMIIINFTHEVLITTTNYRASKSQELNMFSVGYGAVDELFLIAYFVIIFKLHLKHNILFFDIHWNHVIFVAIIFFQFGLFCPFQVSLITSTVTLVSVFAVFYSFSQFYVTFAVFVYCTKLYRIIRQVRTAMADMGVFVDSPSRAAEECHRKHVSVFREASDQFGLLNVLVLVHTMVVITIQANVILMYLFNNSYQHPGTLPRLFFTIIWCASYVLKVAAICFASDELHNAWRELERKLGQQDTVFNLSGILEEKKFWATKCCVVNTPLFYAFMGMSITFLFIMFQFNTFPIDT